MRYTVVSSNARPHQYTCLWSLLRIWYRYGALASFKLASIHGLSDSTVLDIPGVLETKDIMNSFAGSRLLLSVDSKGKLKWLCNYPDREGDKATKWNSIWGKEGEAMIGKVSSNSFEILNLIITNPTCENASLSGPARPHFKTSLHPYQIKKQEDLLKLSDSTLGT